MSKRRNTFRDELQTTLLKNALIPLLVAATVIIAILGFLFVNNNVLGTRKDAANAKAEVEQLFLGYADTLREMADGLDLDRFVSDRDYHARINSDFYRFINQRTEKPRIYLLDGSGNILFSTETDSVKRADCAALIRWRVIRLMRKSEDTEYVQMARDLSREQETGYLFFGKRLTAAADDGYICFAIPDGNFARLFDEYGSSIVIADRFDSQYYSGLAVFPPILGKVNPLLRGVQGFFSSETSKYYCSVLKTESGLFSVYAVRECGTYLVTIFYLLLVVILAFVIIFCAVTVSSKRIADKETRIIDEIAAACQEVQHGKLDSRLSISEPDEFRIIGESYNRMLDSIGELMEHSALLARETAVSRIKQLESQFNPHFLYNTLETVRYMIRLDPKAANQMIVDLSKLLRYSIQSGSESVPLGEDLVYTQNYVNILKVRFGKRLEYFSRIPAELESMQVPRLIIQPLIENSVKYCMDRTDCLRIEVEAEESQDCILIRVSDNGGGIEKETLCQLNERMRCSKPESQGHFGILNVHERIRLTYGDPYGVQIFSDTEGTRICLRFPRQRGGKGK